MKKLCLLLIICSLSLSSSCESDDAKNPESETWFLVNVSGGFAGINEDVDKGSVIWTFNSQDSNLKIENNSDNNYSFESGNYSYSVLSANNNNYLVIENNEFGGMIETNSELIIDQNMQSNGSGADKFILRFEK
ncbi:MAG TPA: hypothetical protein VKN14_08555 [Flavobacteriaceae bacterium]|nr:hypothetical protein [Flavobacteriaceae bacterium]